MSPAPPTDPDDDGDDEDDYSPSEDRSAHEEVEEELRVLREGSLLLGYVQDAGHGDEDDDHLDSRSTAAEPSAENSTSNIGRTRATRSPLTLSKMPLVPLPPCPPVYGQPLHALSRGFAQDQLPRSDQDLHATSRREPIDRPNFLLSNLREETLQRPLIQEVGEAVAPAHQRQSSTSSSSSSDDANIWNFTVDDDDDDDGPDSNHEEPEGGTDFTTSADESDSDSSGSDSSSEDDEATRTPTETTEASNDSSDASSTSSSSDDSIPDELPAGTIQEKKHQDVPPGSGLTRTQKRNRRRREQRRRETKQDQLQPADDADLLARKRALLNAVDAPDQIEDLPTAASVDDTPMAEDTLQDQQTERVIATGSSEGEDTTSRATPADAAAQEEAPRQRLRMDVGAGRRLLFGALGLKNPKTKADEEKLKQDLMKDVRPLKNHRQEEASPAIDTDEDDFDWQAKIRYQATEAGQEGIELSEPPFPFVQRWDPQQQSRPKRKRGSQKQGAKDIAAEDNNDTSNIELNYDDPQATSNSEQSQSTDVDDLPSLPRDVATLPLLQSTEVKPGMVITWKQLAISAATNWQPQISSPTAVVISSGNDGTLQVMLAKRDRNPEKQYDPETGRRVYARFEMPSDSDDEAESDDGRRELAWAELDEPRLVQAEPDHESDELPHAKSECSGDSSTIPPGQSAPPAHSSSPMPTLEELWHKARSSQSSLATDAAEEPAPKRARRRSSEPFRLPEGSEIITLSSSPGTSKSPETAQQKKGAKKS